MPNWKKVVVSGSDAVLNSVTASFTGSLAGTASYATQALSASYAPGGSSTPAFPYTGSAIISGSLTITGSLQVGIPGTNDAAIDTTVGTLSRGTQARVDWLNGSLYNTSGVLTADWENTTLYDASGILSLAWNDRVLYTPGGNSFAWDNEYATTSTLYQYYVVGITTQNDFIDNLSEPFVGQIIEGI